MPADLAALVAVLRPTRRGPCQRVLRVEMETTARAGMRVGVGADVCVDVYDGADAVSTGGGTAGSAPLGPPVPRRWRLHLDLAGL